MQDHNTHLDQERREYFSVPRKIFLYTSHISNRNNSSRINTITEVAMKQHLWQDQVTAFERLSLMTFWNSEKLSNFEAHELS